MTGWLQRWHDRRKITKLRRELAALLRRDRAIRDVSGRTTAHVADAMLKLGHRIAVLRAEILSIEESER